MFGTPFFGFTGQSKDEKLRSCWADLTLHVFIFGFSFSTIFCYIINNENGTCGVSVSDTTSTLMARIEIVILVDGFAMTGNVSAMVEVEGNAVVGEEKKMELAQSWMNFF